jgi:hypothetical protein
MMGKPGTINWKEAVMAQIEENVPTSVSKKRVKPRNNSVTVAGV